jgi:hypothetical protein
MTPDGRWNGRVPTKATSTNSSKRRKEWRVKPPRPRLPEALFVLLGLANRRTEAAALSRNSRFRGMGEARWRGCRAGRRHPDHAALADPPGTAPEGLCAASSHDAGRDPRAHAGRLGSVLQSSAELSPLPVYTDAPRPPRVRLDFEALSSDVCESWHRDGQRASQSVPTAGAPDCPPVPPPILPGARSPHSGPCPIPEMKPACNVHV